MAASSSDPIDRDAPNCTWKRTTNDSTSTCLIQPRSCYDCLNVLPATGEACTLSPSGLCLPMSSYDSTQDYRRLGPSSAWPPHRNYFPSTNTTYCEQNDSVCKLCQDGGFQNWKQNPSQYCVGQSGCLCVAVCEAEEWEQTVYPELQAIVQNNSTNCTVRIPPDTNSMTNDNHTSIVLTKSILASDDPCLWYQNQTLCGAPRTCVDCLNTRLYSGEHCMLHSNGMCLSMDLYNVNLDYRRHPVNQTGRIVIFPSTNTTYCGIEDPACIDCTSPNGYCIGEHGCVCVTTCSSSQWKKQVATTMCVNTTAQLDKNGVRMSTVLFIVVMGVVLVVLMCGMGGLSLLRRRRRRQQLQATIARRQQTVAGQQQPLELRGWKALCEALIENEREFIQGSSRGTATGTVLTSRPTGLHVDDGEEQAPSQRRLTRSLSVTTPTLVMDDSETSTYRPISPSHMQTHV